MGLLSLILVLSLTHFAFARNNQFNVIDFGAIGDGVTNNAQAFQKAWKSACDAAGTATIVVPAGGIFLIGPTSFVGQCKATNINVEIMGNIVAPASPSAWKGIGATKWLMFQDIRGLSVSGKGTIDGRGAEWWKRSCAVKRIQGCNTEAPTMVAFFSCHGLQLRGLTLKNSQQMHLTIQGSQGANVTGLKIIAPEASPNTDGIHLQDSNNVFISHSTISTGDDCISIGNGSSDIYIEHIKCGPGHGISVGSLGHLGSTSAVENIYVRYVDFYGTTNGARIKTWQGGKGYARTISFENLNFTNVRNPVIIDQYYCLLPQGCLIQADAVKVSNVTYSHLQGTSMFPEAITVNCSRSVGCTDIHFDTVNIVAANRKDKAVAKCSNAKLDKRGNISPPILC